MKLGYVRTSAGEESLAAQLEAIRAAGAVRIWEDHGISGSAVLKPAYMEMCDYARPGDEIIVWRLDRLSRSLITLICDLQALGERQVEFRSLCEDIDTTAPEGRSFFHTVAAFTAFGHDVQRERAEAETGMGAARLQD
ncbi:MULTISPECIES: recombinase family protein [unclassified Novosphingobium]|jgi:DNA invertase Pin-like site-specific DNA recombinase|uniref:Resolvase domain-containing protein n=1 Tax=Ochrobactrum sp. PW1 TaxID=1882222 RepID=A0A292GNA3_9HYPH|nr:MULTISPECIES: recombinase family protein [unclassified Novosphingobium]BBA74328.1 resolvase domain-containing protein [Ochrobactrum sp. PW1]GFM29177.1 resolvase domain-containing protein [Novosphingobium sp. PY1]CCA90923.1 resolvase domain-containing protein [Novosphingobium sp. PP1Y]